MPTKISDKSNAAELEMFESIVKLVRKLIDDRIIWVKITSPDAVQFVIERRDFDIQVLASGLPKDEVQKVLDNGLAEKLSGVMRNLPARFYTSMRSGPRTSGKEDPEFEAATERMEKEFAIIRKHLVTEQLQKRFSAKTHSIRDVFVDCEWQVSQSLVASRDADGEDHITSVTIRFLTQKRPVATGRRSAILATLIGDSDVDVGASFDLDSYEIEYLLSVLRRAQNAARSPQGDGDS